MLKVLALRIFTIILLILLFALVKGGWNIYQKQREAYLNKINTEAKLEELSNRKRQLQAEVLHLKSSRGIEEEIRQQFEVAREGEGLIIIVDRPTAEGGDTGSTKNEWWRPVWPW